MTGAVSESRLSNLESESEPSPLSPSPSPSHHLKVRVRVRVIITSESESESASPSHESSSPQYSTFVYLPKHENKQQNVSNVRVNSATRHGRYCLDSGVTRARVTISESESESESKWKKLDSSPSPSKMDSSPSPYSSHTALLMTAIPHWGTMQWGQVLVPGAQLVQQVDLNWWNPLISM